jgi:hypothetical protein
MDKFLREIACVDIMGTQIVIVQYLQETSLELNILTLLKRFYSKTARLISVNALGGLVKTVLI